MATDPIVIVGAGPAGLGCAHRLTELGVTTWRLFEATDRPGGLARSVVDDAGFTWDLGGHVQFSHYEYFDELMESLLGPSGWWNHQRESWVWIRERFVPYPFQLNLHRLPAADRDRCVEGLREAARSALLPAAPPKDFGAWIDRTFGAGLAAVFMRPYNFKVWAYPPESMDWGWIGERVAVPDLERVERNIRLARDDVSWGPNRTFRFPKRGGTGAIWQALADRLPRGLQHYERPVARVDTKARAIHLADGERVAYQALVSTAPLDQLVAISDRRDLDAAAAKLVHSSTHVVGIGLRGAPPAALKTKCWMYFPEPDCPFYRVTVFSNYSPHNAPTPGHWSLMAEVSESPVKPVDEGAVAAECLEGLRRARLIPPSAEVVSVWTQRLPYGYPTPFLGRDEVLAQLLPPLERVSVYARGRFGAWKYEVSNQDHAYAQGREIADRLMQGAPEVTIHHPGWVNHPLPRPPHPCREV